MASPETDNQRMSRLTVILAALAVLLAFFSWEEINPRTPLVVATLIVAIGGLFLLLIDSETKAATRFGLAQVRGAGMVVAVIIAVGAGVLAQKSPNRHHSTSEIPLEAQLGVLNPSITDKYTSSTNATIGQTVDVEVYFYNIYPLVVGPVARSVSVSIYVPSGEGSRNINATVGGNNTNQLGLAAHISIPNDAQLEYVTGTAQWKHNPSQSDRHFYFVTTRISDALIGTGVDLGNAGPCTECQETVFAQFRVAAVAGS